MTAELKFVTLDDKTHVIGFSEHTACGLPIPMGETYTFDEPKSLCSQCQKLTDGSDEYGVLKSVIEGTAEPEPAPEPEKPKAKGGSKA
jgi:hypothetical protein